MTLTHKGTRAASATAENILKSDPKNVASEEKENEDNKHLDSKKHDKAIAEWIG